MSPNATLLPILVSLALAPAPARAGDPPRGPAAPAAQIFEGIRVTTVADLDPSLRSAGMGRAGTAVF